jgi:hypothetical protein
MSISLSRDRLAEPVAPRQSLRRSMYADTSSIFFVANIPGSVSVAHPFGKQLVDFCV